MSRVGEGTPGAFSGLSFSPGKRESTSLLAHLLDERPDWQSEAVCASVDPEIFYPEEGGGTTTAKRICDGCPVRVKCLTEAIRNNEEFGVWGGMSARERARIPRLGQVA